ncbi:MAG: L-glutamine:2-deoxy-scyllo-inosose aminotransferase [Candidatus Latescibacterota bacterium]|nr:MAG: L-glutamine:2-deoxy-scyllo-inosose aminotransferase [Candidatus Latescibacterota bacterium]
MAELAINGGTPVGEKFELVSWPLRDEKEVRKVVEVTRSGRWSYDGPKEAEFTKAFAEFIGSKYALAAANGTVTLQLALEALDIGFGDEVIVPGLTWQATAAAVLDINAVPILVDIEPETYCINPERVIEAITPRTRAIIPVHLYECMADMDQVMEIAGRYHLHVVEDCAHTHGSRWRNQGAGTIGDIGSFSMQQSKVMTSGEGGALTTNSEELFHKLYSLKNCGGLYTDEAGSHGEHVQSGNYRITEFQAAVLVCQLERLKSHIDQKDENAQYFSSLISEIEGVIPFLRREQVTRQSHYAFGFRYNKEVFGGVPVQKFCQALSAEIGLGVSGPYEPLNNCSLYQPHTKKRYRISDEHWKAIDPRRFSLPVAERAYCEEGVLMSHQVLLGTRKDIESICDAVVKIRENMDELIANWRSQR